tara:strand:+ start:223 stop:939 length:717 start_codon:yes stop_codon:yes gene_type:complete
MNREKKIKLFLGLSYLVLISIFLWIFFKYFSLEEITSFDFIKNNYEYLNQIKQSNFFFVSLLFILFTIIWVLMLGFGSPIILLSGFIFGNWIGSIYATIALSIGATILYLIATYFFKDMIEKKFSSKFIFLKENFKKSEFNYFLLYRFIGGIPFFISNILPTIFNVKLKNFFFGTIFGTYPQTFVWASLGSGLANIIENNLNAPSFTELIVSPEIYIPVIGFVIILISGIIFKNIFYK